MDARHADNVEVRMLDQSCMTGVKTLVCCKWKGGLALQIGVRRPVRGLKPYPLIAGIQKKEHCDLA